MHAWRQNNKERTIALHHAYHARKRGAPGHFTAVDIQRLWNEQNGVCAAPHCSTSLEVSCTVEHKIPLSRGGSNWPANLQLFCSPCNSSKGTKTMAEWLAVLDARRQPCLTEIATPCHSINCKEHLTPSPECAITSPLAQ
jgi:5-methylcytosine-specific restriction endonuclease McrA